MRLTPQLLAVALAVSAATAAEANESAYTERNLDACKTISQTDEGPSVTLKCAGYKDFPVYFKYFLIVFCVGYCYFNHYFLDTIQAVEALQKLFICVFFN